LCLHWVYKNNPEKYKKLTAISSILLNILLWVFGVKITVTDKNRNPLPYKQRLKYFQKNKLIVSNHLSYIDIALFQSILRNNCFISHHEVKQQSPLLYFISRLSGSYFIERSIKNIRQELRDIADILKSKVNLVLFAEGTSTDGSGVLPFHSLFFSAAGLANKDVLPVCINYTHINGQPFSLKNRDRICWYKETHISFLQHLFSFFELKSVKITITFCEPIKNKGKNSRTLATESHRIIATLFRPAK